MNELGLNDDEMDGGITILEGGRKARIVLDARGVFKETRPLGKAATAAAERAAGGSDMNAATERTLKRMEEAASRTEAAAARAEKAAAGAGKKKPAENDDQGGQGAGGFIPPA